MYLDREILPIELSLPTTQVVLPRNVILNFENQINEQQNFQSYCHLYSSIHNVVHSTITIFIVIMYLS